MSERTVAELIGWKYHPKMDAWKAPGRHEFRVTRHPTTPPDLDADDLLAWLRAQGWQARSRVDDYDFPAHLTDVPVRLIVFCVSVSHEVEGSTLLAALEAAVRAVAGES